MKIFDCFPFFNELDLLEIRLNILNEIVDVFVICEAEHTHSNNYKGYILQQNKDRFKKFGDKIRYIQIDKNQFNSSPWYNENLQRNSLLAGLSDLNEQDICILSDLDEIPNPETVKKVVRDKKIPCTLTTNLFYGYLNTVVENLNTRQNNGSIILNKDVINSYNNLQHFRNIKDNLENIPDGGWHFSFCVGNNIDKAVEKIQSFAHQEFNTEHVLSNVEHSLLNEEDILSRSGFKRVIDNTLLPEYIRNNKNVYQHLLK